VADARAAGHPAEPPVERIGRAGVAILMEEHEIVVMSGGAGLQALSVLPCLYFLRS
jgi:hypothetical protein